MVERGGGVAIAPPSFWNTPRKMGGRGVELLSLILHVKQSVYRFNESELVVGNVLEKGGGWNKNSRRPPPTSRWFCPLMFSRALLNLIYAMLALISCDSSLSFSPGRVKMGLGIAPVQLGLKISNSLSLLLSEVGVVYP